MNTGHSSCAVTSPGLGGGGGGLTETGDLGYCGDKICQDGKEGRAVRGESFYNCAEDCAVSLSFGDLNLDTLVTNCIDKEKQGECFWLKNMGLTVIFGFIFLTILFTVLFEFKSEKTGFKRWIIKKRFKRKR